MHSLRLQQPHCLNPSAHKGSTTVVATRVARHVPLIRRRVKGQGKPSSAVAQQATAEQEEKVQGPPKPKFNHAYMIFNPAAGQENPVSEPAAKPLPAWQGPRHHHSPISPRHCLSRCGTMHGQASDVGAVVSCFEAATPADPLLTPC